LKLLSRMLAGIQLNAIVAMADNRVIGNGNKLPWHLPEDLKYFSQLTKGHAVLMGRKTYESLPEKFRPLPQRLNLVLSSSLTVKHPDVRVFSSVEHLSAELESGAVKLPSKVLWLIGGAAVYQELLEVCDKLYLTRVQGNFVGDVFLPDFESRFTLVSVKDFSGGKFEEYQRVPS
jgi:dihydrofolate reductase